LRLDNLLSAYLISWLKDESLEASDNLPDPDVIARETNKCGMGNAEFGIEIKRVKTQPKQSKSSSERS
jgi:hypothetical protein